MSNSRALGSFLQPLLYLYYNRYNIWKNTGKTIAVDACALISVIRRTYRFATLV